MPKCRHSWRNIDRPYKDGTVLQQCRKCGRFREANIVVKGILIIVGVALAAVTLVYLLSQIQ